MLIMTRSLSLTALLLSSTVCTALPSNSAAPNETASQTNTKTSSKGPQDSQEIEAYADPV
jgi:hypothetical protein